MKSIPGACLFLDVVPPCRVGEGRAGEARGGLRSALRGEMSLSARSLVALMSANEVRPPQASWDSSTRRGDAEGEARTRACACVRCGGGADGSATALIRKLSSKVGQ